MVNGGAVGGAAGSGVTRIDQVLPALSSRDAIGDHVLQVQRALRARGYVSDLYFGDASPDRLEDGLHVSRIGDHPPEGRILLYHLSIGSPVADVVLQRPERTIVYYHNITPAHYLAPWAPHVEAESRLGRDQLAALAPVTELALAASAFNERELAAAGYRSTVVSPMLLDLDRFDGRPDPVVAERLAAARRGGGADLLFVGKVSPHKGQADLVKALYVYRALYDPQARLHLVGAPLSDAYRRSVQAFADRLGLGDAVEFAGSVRHDELIAYYRACDAFVCLSDHEGVGVPLVEAMYHGLPIVTVDRAAIPETVHGAAIVLPDKDPVLVAAAIARVTRDAQLRSALTDAARRRLATFQLDRTSAWLLRCIDAATTGAAIGEPLAPGDDTAVPGDLERAVGEIVAEAGRRRTSGELPTGAADALDATFLDCRPTEPRPTEPRPTETRPAVPRPAAPVGHPLTVGTALGFLFPSTSDDQRAALASRWGPDTEVRSLSDLRLLLGSVDHDTFASPVEVHIGREDIVVVEVDGVSLALDRHDHAISRPIIDGTGHDPWLADVAAAHCRPGMTVVDIGANVGYFTMLAWAAVGDGGRVVAVEPRSDNCRLLLLSAGLNSAFSIELLPVAADRNRGLAHLGVAIGTNGGFVGDDPSALLDGRAVVVPTFPLDDLVDGPVDLIKVDVEGAEGRVMDGAASLLATYRPVVVTELSPTMLEAISEVSCEEYLARFADLSYDVHEIDPVARTTGPAEGIAELLGRWGDPTTIRNLILLPRAVRS